MNTPDFWQEAFDQAIEAGADAMLASSLADEAVADFLSSQTDNLYDHWRDLEN
jgi:hypothetical protein